MRCTCGGGNDNSRVLIATVRIIVSKSNNALTYF